MKLYKSLLIGLVAVVGLSSCNDWLDVNKNPNTPNVDETKYEQALPTCQFYMNHIYGIVASNSSYYTGNYYRNNGQQGGAAKWIISPTSSFRNSTAHQWFYCMVANPYKFAYEKAMAAGAYHYAAAFKFLRAWGYIMLVDNMGEVPFTDACGASPSPYYDSGQYIYTECLKELDQAIELFSKAQEPGASALAAADYWNGGDVQKWIKACYLFKARWMNHMSKKSAGKWDEGKYDEAEILACLEKAQQSNADNTIIRHTDTNTNSHDVMWGEPIDYNPQFSCIGMNTNCYITKTYFENLTNFDEKGIEDPRANKFIPWARSEKTATTPVEVEGQKIAWSADGKWRRSVGVDLQSNILSENGPYALTFSKDKNGWYCDNASRTNDTVYVWMMCGGQGYYRNVSRNLFIQRNGGGERAELSGVFTVRATTPSYVATYTEACFIKAEVLMRKGDKGGAFTAFKNAVRASIDDVNEQLKIWAAEYPDDAENPSIKPFTDAEIDAFINGALGTPNDITMGKIITQKLIAMAFSEENWNDMRRFDYDKNIFMNWDKPLWYKNNTGDLQKYCPEGSAPRRWPQASYETKYNVRQLQECFKLVPWAKDYLQGAEQSNWYNNDRICTVPVWWDRAE